MKIGDNLNGNSNIHNGCSIESTHVGTTPNNCQLAIHEWINGQICLSTTYMYLNLSFTDLCTEAYTLAYMTLTAAIATCIATEVKVLNVSHRFMAIKHRGG